MIIVEGIQHPKRLGHSSKDHQDVKDLMGGANLSNLPGYQYREIEPVEP
jgi:hypothetical protein